jgi:hypothetical protein
VSRTWSSRTQFEWWRVIIGISYPSSIEQPYVPRAPPLEWLEIVRSDTRSDGPLSNSSNFHNAHNSLVPTLRKLQHKTLAVQVPVISMELILDLNGCSWALLDLHWLLRSLYRPLKLSRCHRIDEMWIRDTGRKIIEFAYFGGSARDRQKIDIEQKIPLHFDMLIFSLIQNQSKANKDHVYLHDWWNQMIVTKSDESRTFLKSQHD